MKIPFTTPTVDSLKDRAENALSIFTKTVNDLLDINKKCQEEIKAREEIIEIATSENTELSNIVSSNNKVITKIEDILK